jgi:hypothetical protein
MIRVKRIKFIGVYFINLLKMELNLGLFAILGVSLPFFFIPDKMTRFIFVYVLLAMFSLLFSAAIPSALFKKEEKEPFLKSIKALPADNFIIFFSIIAFVYLSQLILIFTPMLLWSCLNKEILLEISKNLNITVFEFIYCYYISTFFYP